MAAPPRFSAAAVASKEMRNADDDGDATFDLSDDGRGGFSV